MILKEIEIQGFKSFADKTKVVFDKGVTAVVGPNGSGKSNITESLRWALGESSVKSLRGGRMPDVIFAGTQTRNPLNFASVTVTLDNSDGFIQKAGAEIQVERQIYRNGDNEYRIDGKKVRLRDIHDLFMDTGLGRDSFSIISQGKVEEIFNSKPEERRSIFEEAAGVLKFKTRRKETESKLNQTQDNLDRLEDIIYELEGQIKPLSKQAETARRFLDLDQERKELYLDVLVAQLQNNKSLLDSIQTDLDQVQQHLSEYYSKRQSLEEANQALKEQRHRLQARVESDNASLLDLTRLLADLERQIEVSRLEQEQAASNRQDIEKRIHHLKEQAQEKAQEKDQRQASLNQSQEEMTKVQEQLTKVEKELEAFSQDPDQLIESLRERVLRIMEEEVLHSNDLTTIKSKLEAQAQENTNRAKEFAQLRQDLEQSQIEETRTKEAYEKAHQAVKDLLVSYEEKTREQARTEEEYRGQQTRMFQLLDDLKSKQARRSSLENILKNHSNFFAGVKSVLQSSDKIGGIVGAVSQQLTFNREYQTALEIAMGASSQHIIVEDEEAATRAIEFLKRNRSGRATFLPLTTIKPRFLADHLQKTIHQAPGFIGMASDLVDYRPEHDSIFKNLLGATAIFDQVDHARAAAKQVRYQVRMVCLDGTELRTGGSYAGGANRQNQSIFIQPELDELMQEISQVEQRLKEVEQIVEVSQAQVNRINEELDTIKTSGEQARLKEQEERLLMEAAQKRSQEFKDLYNLQAAQLDDTSSKDLLEKQAQLDHRLTKLAQEKDKLNQEIEAIKSDKDAIQARFQELSQEAAQLRLQLTELRSQKGFQESTVGRLLSELQQLEEEEEALNLLLEEKDQPHEKRDIHKLQAQLQEANQQKEQINQGLIRAKFELEDMEGQAEDLEEQLEQARKKNEDWIRQQAQAEAQKEKVTEKLHQLINRLTEDYQMSFEEASETAKELDNLALAEEEVKHLEKSIKALGPVNLDAITQFDEVKERLDFLSSQRDDVLSAKQLLENTITEMNDEVRERFKTTFEAIRESFQLTFKQMFGGGSADLILTDGDLLTAGVDISVQPPGKKIQSLNLMSGGEKALSALALLFSIIRVKTIPFVILDEVEAALDEANVKRFGDYLNRFDKDSQFIVVTHRKGTMAAADSIYGVTMQESGVSKIVSVKLKDLDGLEA